MQFSLLILIDYDTKYKPLCIVCILFAMFFYTVCSDMDYYCTQKDDNIELDMKLRF